MRAGLWLRRGGGRGRGRVEHVRAHSELFGRLGTRPGLRSSYSDTAASGDASSEQGSQSAPLPRHLCPLLRCLLRHPQTQSSDTPRLCPTPPARPSPPPSPPSRSLIAMPAIVDKIADALHLSKHKHDPPHPQSERSSSQTPAFDHTNVTVLFVLGGPGAGT